MKNGNNNQLNFTGILIRDISGKGFSGYIKEVPEAIAEGENEKETISNLLDALKIILKFKGEENLGINYENDQIVERSLSFSML